MRRAIEWSAEGGGGERRTRTTPCCGKVGLKRGPWTAEEDQLLSAYINTQGEGRWRTLPKRAGLLRCGKSCRLRWMNYLRPCVKRGHITPDEEDIILRLHRLLGNRWSLIAGRIPGRTDNEIKNYWNTHLSKKLINQGIDPRTHKHLINPTSSKSHQGPPLSSSDPLPVQKSNTGGGGDGVEQQPLDGCFGGVDLEGGFGGEEDISIYGDDDVFSSFLNSLITEEDVPPCISHHQQVSQPQPVSTLSGEFNQQLTPQMIVYLQSFGFENNWESSSFISPDDHQPLHITNAYGCVKPI